MPWITVLVTLIIVGIALWAINAFIPMDRRVRAIVNLIVVVVVIIWLLSVFGILGGLQAAPAAILLPSG